MLEQYLSRFPMPDVKNRFLQLLCSGLRKCVLQRISEQTLTRLSETEDGVINIQNYPHPDDHTMQTTDTPGFKQITMINIFCLNNV